MPRERCFEGHAPSWIHCELCERQGAQRQELFVVAEDEAHNGGTAESVALALLCTDCSALAGGAIDPLGWRRRTNFHLKNECAPPCVRVSYHSVVARRALNDFLSVWNS
jgi:hypothetical protein